MPNMRTDLRAMLRKFGVVTVMDVKAYKAERYLQDDASENHYYSKGEWDSVSTFKTTRTQVNVTIAQGEGSGSVAVVTAQAPKTGAENYKVYLRGIDQTTLFNVSYASNELTLALKTGSAAADTTYVVAYDLNTAIDKEPLFELDTLKIANINSEGPTKSITGGQNADTLLKYGKTFTIEMQDALGRYDVLESIFGVNFSANHQFASVTDRFPAELTIVGSTFVIDQKTGAKQPIKVVLPIFLGDGILNLTQDAEGDASVFDLNGSLLRFNGIDGGAGTIVDCGESRFVDGHPIDKMIYAAGQDNEFYFLCTNEGFDLLKSESYAEAYIEEYSA